MTRCDEGMHEGDVCCRPRTPFGVPQGVAPNVSSASTGRLCGTTRGFHPWLASLEAGYVEKGDRPSCPSRRCFLGELRIPLVTGLQFCRFAEVEKHFTWRYNKRW